MNLTDYENFLFKIKKIIFEDFKPRKSYNSICAWIMKSKLMLTFFYISSDMPF